jgi:hypothetical protein
MGILDDAIREHLDLKRRHGARDAELREIEDEAFGSGEEPDAFAGSELYAEVGSADAPDVAVEPPDAGNEEPTRLVESEALRPPDPATESEDLPSPPAAPESLRPSDLTPARELDTSDDLPSEPPSPIPGQTELPGQDEIPGQESLDAAAEAPPVPEEPVSEEIAEPPAPPPPPSESLEELIAEEEPFPEDEAAPPPAPEPPSDPESRPLEPQADAQAPPEPDHVPDPPPPPPAQGSEPPGRARGRIDVPTQEHPPPGDTGDLPPLPGDEPELGRPDTSYEPPPLELPEDEPISDEQPISDELPVSEAEPISDEEPLPSDDAADEGGPQLYDFETDEEPLEPATGEPAVDDDFEALGPAEEEAPYLDEEEPYAEEPGTEVRPAIEEEKRDEGEEDLWFEKGPPKDFDFE